jgi:hypothetical protein
MGEEHIDTIKALAEGMAEGIGSQIPIYDDLFKPSMLELRKGLSGAVKIALAPISTSVWAYSLIGNWLQKELENRLIKTPIDKIVTPDISLVGPAVESIKFLDQEPELRNLFAQLIASSMDARINDNLHASFVEVIKNLSREDALILKFLNKKPRIYMMINSYTDTDGETRRYFPTIWGVPKSVGDLSRAHNSIINLKRLGLIESLDEFTEKDNQEFEKLERLEDYRQRVEQIRKINGFTAKKRVYAKTFFGRKFCQVCIS